MRSTDIQHYLASASSRPRSELDQRARPLRVAEKVTPGPRGHGAPHMDQAEAALHVLSMVSRRPAQALEVAERLMIKCLLRPKPNDFELVKALEHFTIGSFVLLAIQGNDLGIGLEYESFEMSEDGNLAFLYCHRRRLKNLRLLFMTDDYMVDRYAGPETYADGVDRFAAQSRFVIGAGHLRRLGNLVAADIPEQPAEE